MGRGRRVVFIVEPKDEKNDLVFETMRGLYGMGTRDFVTAVDEGHIILVKELENNEEYPEILQAAKIIVDTLSMEAMVNVRVSYGTIVQELKEVSRSYKEADTALKWDGCFMESAACRLIMSLESDVMFISYPDLCAKCF